MLLNTLSKKIGLLLIIILVLVGIVVQFELIPPNFSNETVPVPVEVAELDNVITLSADEPFKFTFEYNRDFTIGESKQTTIGHIAGFTVDEYGMVYLADRGQSKIHVFDEQGTLVTSVGRKGRGPGEFITVGWPQTNRSHLYAADLPLSRIQAFSKKDFSHDFTINVEPGSKVADLRRAQPGGFYLLENNDYIVAYDDNINPMTPEIPLQRYLYRVNNKGAIVSDQILKGDLFKFLGSIGSGLFPNPFTRQDIMKVGQSGLIYSANIDHFLIKIHDSDGTYERAIFVPLPKVRLDLDRFLEKFDNRSKRQMIRNAEVPETHSAIKTLVVDDEHRIWVAAVVEDLSVYQWWVISNSGELISKFTLPRKRDIQLVKNGAFYTNEKQQQTGAEHVVKYKFHFKE